MPAPPLKVSLGSPGVAREQSFDKLLKVSPGNPGVAREQSFEKLPQLPSGTASQSSVLSQEECSVKAKPAVSDTECAKNKACDRRRYDLIQR